MYIFLSLLYAILIGFFGVFEKLARKNSHSSVILVMFTTVTFLLSLIWIPFGIAIPIEFIPIFVLKGLLLSISWFFILQVTKNADISLVTSLGLVSVLFTFLLGIFVFNESVDILQIFGIILILVGISIITILNKKEKGKIKPLYVILILISAVIATISSVIDKYTTTYLTNFQVQFWFLLFVFIFSWIFFGIECMRNKQFLIKKQDLKNYWIYLVGIFLFVGDLMLFLAYKSPNSQMIIITILSKLKVLVTIFFGIIVFKEKNILKKILLTILIVIGTVLIAL